jgi:hypothetical protein
MTTQSNFEIANQGFPTFRGDLNDALQALASNSEGDTQPSTRYPYQFWYDTTTNILKMRNAANSAWINIFSFDQGAGTWSANANNLTVGGSQVFYRGNILGTVSQTSGVPTGAILERGSNANGDYIKFADGTLICWLTTPTLTASIAVGNVFTSTVSSPSFPATFSVAPAISASATRLGGTTGHWAGSVSSSTTGATARLLTAVTGATGTIDIIAVGRWF